MIGRMAKEYASLRRRPFLTPLWLWMWSSTAVVLLVGLALWAIAAAPTTLLVLVAADPGGDVRPERLSEMLRTPAGASVAAVVADPAVKPTAESLAAELRAPIVYLSSDLASVVSRYRGQTVVVIASHGAIAGLLDRYAPGAPPAPVYFVAVPRFSRAALLPVSLP